MTPPSARRVVVVGGYGAFGERAVERLARSGDIEIVIAGRSAEKAVALAARMARAGGKHFATAVVNAEAPDVEALKNLGVSVVLNASGPFQKQNYALARAAVAIGAHYVDLADARAFVTGIVALDADAKAAGVLVTSGASSVPALAAAIIDHHLPEFQRLDLIEHGITPANGYDPGIATTASILGGLGKPISMLIDGRWTTGHGWLGLKRVDIPELGRRWMTDCDVPDLSVFPERYRGVRTVRFRAGLDVSLFQLALWALAGLAKGGLLQRPERFAPLLMWLKRRLRFLGGTDGGMIVRLAGVGRGEPQLERIISLVARDNQGPFVPVIAAVVVTRKLLRGELRQQGAMPCVGLMGLAEFQAETADLPIAISVT